MNGNGVIFTGRKLILLFTSFLIFPITYFAFKFLPLSYPIKTTFILAMVIYWIIIFILTSLITETKLNIFKTILRPRHKPRWTISYNFLALTPIAGVFFITFVPNVSELTFINFLIIFLISLINGTIEETYWRGLYLIHFRNNFKIGIWLSTFLFALWHVSLYKLNGISYRGGFLALVGGAFFMGLIWSYVSQKTGNIFYSILAHVLVNIFAFTGLFVANNF